MNETFKSVVMSTLLLPHECQKQPQLVEYLQKTLKFGCVVPLVRREKLDLLGEVENFVKANSKASKVKSVIVDASTSGFYQTWTFHAERRDYLRYQLKQILNLCDDAQLLVNKSPVSIYAMDLQNFRPMK